MYPPGPNGKPDDPNKILILQTSTGGLGLTTTFLRREGIVREKDFVGLHDTRDIEERMFENQPQLLFTSTFGGQIQPVVRMVEELREKNPQLVVIFLSTAKVTHPDFESSIFRLGKDWMDEMIIHIKKFRDGSLRRK